MNVKRFSLLAALALCFSAAACSGSRLATEPTAPRPIVVDSPDGPTDAQLAVSRAQGDPLLVPGRYIVILVPGSTDAQRDALAASLATAPTHVYTSLFKGFAGDMTPTEVQRLQADPQVRLLQQDRWNALPPGETGADADGGRTASSQSKDWGVIRIHADQNTGARGSGVGVAVLDTGCDLNHPDLIGGYVGVSFNGIFPTRDGDDDFGHGTHCAGIIGMRDNTIGYVGVAPDCTLVPVKGLNERGYGETSWIVMGMDWIDQHRNDPNLNILVVSMSFGGFGYDGAEDAAIQQGTTDGLVFVAAAGNSSVKIPDNFFSPACLSNVIAVSALQNGDTLANFSDWGPRCDLIAPGVSILSTFPSDSVNGGYASFSGTSMACPHVSGCCALWFSAHTAPGGAANYTSVFAALLANSEAAPPGGWPNGHGFTESEPLVNALNLDQP
jgi:subtilisin family serine protease